MTQLVLQLPESVFASLHQAPDEFGQELRVAAAVKWYEPGKVSQGKAAEIAGLSRSAFISAQRYQTLSFRAEQAHRSLAQQALIELRKASGSENCVQRERILATISQDIAGLGTRTPPAPPARF